MDCMGEGLRKGGVKDCIYNFGLKKRLDGGRDREDWGENRSRGHK